MYLLLMHCLLLPLKGGNIQQGLNGTQKEKSHFYFINFHFVSSWVF